jgi:hypothetical protein
MHLYQWCQWIESTSIGASVRNSDWLFPVIESVHMLGIILLVGATGLFDLRLLGRGPLRQQPVSQIARQVMPWVWGSFAVMFVTGVLMFSSEATRCYQSWCFRAKMILLLLAGLNAFIFQFGAFRYVANWDEGAREPPAGARVAAWTSLVLWVLIVFAGRGIAYY